MRRPLLVAAVFLAGVLFPAGTTVFVGAQEAAPPGETPDARETPRIETVRTVREGVTAGALTIAPVEYSYRSGTDAAPGLVLATEDRRLRIMNGNGELVTEHRTGIRNPQALLVFPGGVLQLTDTDGTPHLYGYRNGRIHGTERTAPRSAGIPAPPIAIYPDQDENVYTLIAPGVIRYTSAAGHRLYQRPLPASIRSHATDGETLFVGLADGRVFGFSRDGQGVLLIRLPAPVVDLHAPVDGGTRFLLALDDTGTLHRLDRRSGGGPEQRELRIRWSRELSGEIRGDGFRFASAVATGPVVVLAPGGGLGVVTPGGHVSWSRTVPGSGFRWAGVYESPAVVIAVTADERLFVFDTSGESVAVRQLQRRPVAMYPLPRRGQLFLEYPDWRYELIEVGEHDGDGPTRPPSVFPASSSAGRDRSGALGALAGSVLDGTSREERRALLRTLTSRLERTSLFGAVGTFRAALVELSSEVYRDPRGRGGVVQNDFPAVRYAAVDLLAQLGDRPSRRALAEVIRHDPDPEVVAAALRGIAACGRDDVSAVITGYERFRRLSDRERGAVAEALVRALESVVPAPEVGDADRFREIAVELASSALPRNVRERAISVGRRW